MMSHQNTDVTSLFSLRRKLSVKNEAGHYSVGRPVYSSELAQEIKSEIAGLDAFCFFL